jgi:hypothetical protein
VENMEGMFLNAANFNQPVGVVGVDQEAIPSLPSWNIVVSMPWFSW